MVHLLSTPPRLRVATRGQRHFVQVQLGCAGDLRTYLRTRGITSYPHASLIRGLEVVELATGVDPVAVQALLDGWDGRG